MEDEMVTSGAKALERGLDLLRAITLDDDRRPLGWHAAHLGIPESTAYRLVAIFVRRGLLVRVGPGLYVGGSALAKLARQPLHRDSLIAIAKPLLTRLSAESRAAAHLGVWDQDMVEYLIRVAPQQSMIFTRQGERLEGYCTAIGKVLLANLPESEREAYLASGPFIALTPHTIIEPKLLREELANIRLNNLSYDYQETAVGLTCVAAPVRTENNVIAAVSLSGVSDLREAKQHVRECAMAITKRLSPPA